MLSGPCPALGPWPLPLDPLVYAQTCQTSRVSSRSVCVQRAAEHGVARLGNRMGKDSRAWVGSQGMSWRPSKTGCPSYAVQLSWPAAQLCLPLLLPAAAKDQPFTEHAPLRVRQAKRDDWRAAAAAAARAGKPGKPSLEGVKCQGTHTTLGGGQVPEMCFPVVQVRHTIDRALRPAASSKWRQRQRRRQQQSDAVPGYERSLDTYRSFETYRTWMLMCRQCSSRRTWELTVSTPHLTGLKWAWRLSRRVWLVQGASLPLYRHH